MKFSTSLVKFGSVGDLALELKKALTAIAAGWNVEHNPDGSHKSTMTLPDTVARRDEDNTFSGGTTFLDNPSIANTGPSLLLNDTDQPVNQRLFILTNGGGLCLLRPTTDVAAPLNQGLTVDRAGNVFTANALYERGRSVPMGEWTDFTPTMTASAGTVTINATVTCRYTLIGKTMILTFYVVITLSAAPNSLTLTLPGGVTAASTTGNAMLDTTGTALMFQTVAATTSASLFRNTAAGGFWPTGGNTIVGTVTFPIQ